MGIVLNKMMMLKSFYQAQFRKSPLEQKLEEAFAYDIKY